MTRLARVRAALWGVVMQPVVQWSAFILVHLWLGYLNLSAVASTYGDVEYVYRFWAERGVAAGVWVGINQPWVYPIVALAPILAASAFGFPHYGATWLSMVLLLDLVAFGVLAGWGRSARSTALGWWWVAFLLLLGPIALGRIDAITVPIAIVAAVLVATRPRVATVLLTVAAWIKIWPAAIVAALVIAHRRRGGVLVAAAATSLVIIAIALALGSGANVFSFVGQQTGRGLQLEAPISTPWLWQAVAGMPRTGVYYDTTILTYQVLGDGVTVAAAVATPLLLLAIAAVCALGGRAVRRGATASALLAPLALALVTTFIAFNKVGSPQFICWLAVPVILGLAAQSTPGSVSFRPAAALVLVIAALTQVVYPTLYARLLSLDPGMVLVLTVRNILEFVLLGWAIRHLLMLPLSERPSVRVEGDPAATTWPLSSAPAAGLEAAPEEPEGGSAS